MSVATESARTVIAERLTSVGSRLTAAAEELVARGSLGVAARIALPGAATPIEVAAGSVDASRTRALSGDELFAIASQSKMFTAACVMLLARDGAIALNDPVRRYVPDVPAVDEDATIDQFLNHTSGIGNFIHALTVLPFPWPRMTYDDLMALAKVHGRQFRAGARLDYNNTDVVVLARLCERVSGQPFEALLAQRVLRPLGMNDTFIAAGGDWPRARMARGYYVPSQGYDGPPLDVAALADYSIASAAGNIVSSLADMLKWSRCLLDSRKAIAPGSIGPGSIGPGSIGPGSIGPGSIGLGHEDFASNVADAGTQSPGWFMPRTYGRGVECWVWGGRRFWGHRGSFFGYHSGTFVDPLSGAAFSMFMTMCTAGSFMRFIELQAHDYMAFMAACGQAAVDTLELA